MNLKSLACRQVTGVRVDPDDVLNSSVKFNCHNFDCILHNTNTNNFVFGFVNN